MIKIINKKKRKHISLFLKRNRKYIIAFSLFVLLIISCKENLSKKILIQDSEIEFLSKEIDKLNEPKTEKRFYNVILNKKHLSGEIIYHTEKNAIIKFQYDPYEFDSKLEIFALYNKKKREYSLMFSEIIVNKSSQNLKTKVDNLEKNEINPAPPSELDKQDTIFIINK